MKLDIYTKEGRKTQNKVDLAPTCFNIKPSPELIHQAVVVELANKRVASAHTKTRGEVRGGGAKPWRQKGTGRARVGSIRSPLWRGGGVVFGPRKERNFKKKMPQKMKKKAILGVLSVRIGEGKVVVISDLKLEAIKTKLLVDLLSKFSLSGNILIITPQKEDIIKKSASNLPSVKVISTSQLNVIDLLWSDYIVLAEKTLKLIQEVYCNF